MKFFLKWNQTRNDRELLLLLGGTIQSQSKCGYVQVLAGLFRGVLLLCCCWRLLIVHCDVVPAGFDRTHTYSKVTYARTTRFKIAENGNGSRFVMTMRKHNAPSYVRHLVDLWGVGCHYLTIPSSQKQTKKTTNIQEEENEWLGWRRPLHGTSRQCHSIGFGSPSIQGSNHGSQYY